MKKLPHILVLLLLTLSGLQVQAQYVVSFELETKLAYASANVTLNGKSWNMDDALIGNLAGDAKNGAKSARVRNTGSMTMQVDMPNGISTVSLYHGGYSSESGNWLLEASTDGGASWTAYASPSQTASGALQLVSFTLNIPGSVRVRLRKTSGGSNRINFDDITISDYVSTTTPPVVTTPTVTAIQQDGARLGANVTAGGNSVITARGIVWSTTTNPALGLPGVTQVTVPDSTGIFDTAVTGLPSGTQIFFRGFATNATGTGYTGNSSFYTLSAAPSGAATNLTATAISNHDIKLDWTAVPGAAGYVILQKMYTAPATFPSNATRYVEGTPLGDADIVDTILSGSVQTATYSGLISGTVYQYAVIPYNYNGTNIETYHYYTQPVVPIAFDTTLGVGPSAISDLVGIQYSEAPTIASIENDTLNADTNGTQVWKLALRDGGASLSDGDDMPTAISRLVVKKGTLNSAGSWLNTIQYAALFDDSSSFKMADAQLYADSMVFTGLNFVAQDNNQKTASLRISLRKTNIHDNDTLQFTIKRNGIVTPGLNNSSQIPALDIRSDSTRNKITVAATQLIITQQPGTTARLNTVLSPAPKLELQDANGNKDLDYAAPLSVYSSKAGLLQLPTVENASNGIVIFDSVVFTSIAQGTILKVKTPGIDTVYTNPINVYASTQSDISTTAGFVYTDSIPYVYFQEAVSLTPSNSVEVYSFTLRDGGVAANDPDVLPTVLSSLGFNLQGSDYIRRIALFQGSTKLMDTTISGSWFLLNNLHITTPDNDSITITIRASFNSRYAHSQQIGFTVQQAIADTSSGSLFTFANAGGAVSSVIGGHNLLKYTPVFVTAPVTQNTSVCKGTSTVLTATKRAGTTLRWYTSASAQTATFTDDSLQLIQPLTTTSYFVEADSAGWTSSRVEVKAAVVTVTAPQVPSTIICRNTPATLQATSVNTVKWYRSFLSEDVLQTGATLVTGNIGHDSIFYVQADSASCKSDRIALNVQVRHVSKPTTNTDTTICRNTTIALSATSLNGALVKWYAQYNASTPVFTGSTFNTGAIQHDSVFYVEADSTGCASERTAVNIEVQQVNAPQLTEDSMTICSGNSTEFTAINTGTINWYDALNATSPLSSGNTFTSPALTTNTTYYVEAIANTCASARIPAYVHTKTTPVPPPVTSATACNGSAAVLTTNVASSAIHWYDAPANGNLLFSGNTYITPALNTNTDFYAEAELDGCYSPRVAFPATVKSIPAQPTTANAILCSGKAIKLGAFASQGSIQWYTNSADSVAFASGDSITTPVLQQTTIYYAATALNGCVSVKKAATLTVNPTPDASFTVNDANQCLHNNQFVFANAQHIPGTRYAWNFGDTTTMTLANPVKTYTHTGTFTVKLKTLSNKGCASETQQMVSVSSPAVDFTFAATGSTVQFTTNLTNIASYKWMFTPQDSATDASPAFTFGASGTYSVSLTITDNNGCVATITKQVQVIRTGIAQQLAATYHLTVFPNPVKDAVNLKYTLNQPSDVSFVLYDLTGSTLYEWHETQSAGTKEQHIGLTPFASKGYLLKASINGQYQVIKLVSQ